MKLVRHENVWWWGRSSSPSVTATAETAHVGDHGLHGFNGFNGATDHDGLPLFLFIHNSKTFERSRQTGSGVSLRAQNLLKIHSKNFQKNEKQDFSNGVSHPQRSALHAGSH